MDASGYGVLGVGFIFWFILVFVCLFVSASIAKKKHRSVAGWVILTLFLGIIATILLALLPTREKVVGSPGYFPTFSDEAVAGVSKKCPQCAEIVKAEAKICRFCGYKFEAKQ